MRDINSSNGDNRTPNRSRASSDFHGGSVGTRSGKSRLSNGVHLSAGALAKLRRELRSLAGSDRPRTIEFALAMMTKYPELNA
jgi:hypothetical protein